MAPAVFDAVFSPGLRAPWTSAKARPFLTRCVPVLERFHHVPAL
ncbi:hypothetical protein ACTMU2_13490 [Cupriavidus basilensis]